MQILFSGPLGPLSHLKIRVPLKPVQGGVADVAHFITGHEQTPLGSFSLVI